MKTIDLYEVNDSYTVKYRYFAQYVTVTKDVPWDEAIATIAKIANDGDLVRYRYAPRSPENENGDKGLRVIPAEYFILEKAGDNNA